MRPGRRGKVHGGCCALALVGLAACVAGLMVGDDVHVHAPPGTLAFAVPKISPQPQKTPSEVVMDAAFLCYPDGESVAVDVAAASWETGETGSYLVLELLFPEVGERTGAIAELRGHGAYVQLLPPRWVPRKPPNGAGEDAALDFDAMLALLAEGGIGLPPQYDGDCLRCGKPGGMHGGDNGLCVDCSDELVYGSEPVADTSRLLRAAVRRELAGGKQPGGLTGAGPWFAIDGQNAWAESLLPEMRELLGPRGKRFTPTPQPDRSARFVATTSARVDGGFEQVMEASIAGGMLAFIAFGIGAVARGKKSER